MFPGLWMREARMISRSSMTTTPANHKTKISIIQANFLALKDRGFLKAKNHTINAQRFTRQPIAFSKTTLRVKDRDNSLAHHCHRCCALRSG